MARPRQIDRDAVLGASLQIADESGLGAVTMQAVARSLGVTPMALYRHVESKDDLLDGVVERLLDELPEPDETLAWDEQLASIGEGVRALARRHPTVFPLLLQLPATTPTSMRARDRVHHALAQAGVPGSDVARLERLISTMVLGFAASEAAGRFRAHSAAVIDEDWVELTTIIARTIEAHLAPDRT